MKLYSFTLTDSIPANVFAPLSRYAYSLFFDSADQSHELSRYSFIAFHPIEIIESKNGRISVTNREQQLSFNAGALDIVRDRLETYGLNRQSRPDLPPFQGGAAGYFGYDLARGLERLPENAADNAALPDMAIGLYDQVYAYDHEKKTGFFMIHAESEQAARARYNHFLRLLEETPPATVPDQTAQDSQWRASHTRRQYEGAVKKIIDYICDGDIFQANMSQRFEADLPPGFDTWGHYQCLRSVNAAPFGAYMNFGRIRIASASPERFLSVRSRQAETRPIKGTIRRSEDVDIDLLHRNQLENSEKDRAENTMIVDLLRNDMSKVCEDHSINVPKLCQLESFARVHHLVSTVRGTLRADQTPADLLKACFPGGSITGAPKVRAMEIIETLEQTRRGPYCGAIGYIGYDGSMDTAITIRTLVYDGATVSFNVGGGIVADSDPAAEYDETMAKADAIFASFEKYAADYAQTEAPATQERAA